MILNGIIYIQFRTKDQGSLELTLENKKETKKNAILQFFYTHLVETHMIINMNVFTLEKGVATSIQTTAD